MIRIELPVDIARPVDEVFNYVTDPAKLGEWQQTMVSATQQTDGPMQKGTRLLEVRSAPFGKRVEALVEVSEFEQNRKFGLRIVSGPLPIDGHHTFSSTDAGTHIDFVAEGRLKGPIRIAAPLLSRVLKRQFKSYYAELKNVLEG